MIQANVLKGIHEVLGDEAADVGRDQNLSQHVAKALGISEAQADTFLRALDSGAPIEDASLEAGIVATDRTRDFLTKLARAIGTAAGMAASKVAGTPGSKTA